MKINKNLGLGFAATSVSKISSPSFGKGWKWQCANLQLNWTYYHWAGWKCWARVENWNESTQGNWCRSGTFWRCQIWVVKGKKSTVMLIPDYMVLKLFYIFENFSNIRCLGCKVSSGWWGLSHVLDPGGPARPWNRARVDWDCGGDWWRWSTDANATQGTFGLNLINW